MEEERDLIGYGRYPPKANWPNNSKVALQFVINYEEGFLIISCSFLFLFFLFIYLF